MHSNTCVATSITILSERTCSYILYKLKLSMSPDASVYMILVLTKIRIYRKLNIINWNFTNHKL